MVPELWTKVFSCSWSFHQHFPPGPLNNQKLVIYNQLWVKYTLNLWLMLFRTFEFCLFISWVWMNRNHLHIVCVHRMSVLWTFEKTVALPSTFHWDMAWWSGSVWIITFFSFKLCLDSPWHNIWRSSSWGDDNFAFVFLWWWVWLNLAFPWVNHLLRVHWVILEGVLFFVKKLCCDLISFLLCLLQYYFKKPGYDGINNLKMIVNIIQEIKADPTQPLLLHYSLVQDSWQDVWYDCAAKWPGFNNCCTKQSYLEWSTVFWTDTSLSIFSCVPISDLFPRPILTAQMKQSSISIIVDKF